MIHRALLVFLLLAFAILGCSSSDSGKGNNNATVPHTVILVIWNSTQRPLEEIRTHPAASYADAGNLLRTPLADDGRFDIEFWSGSRVTVMRRNVDGGKLIAFTTAHGLVTPTDGFTLEVFQESFRLLPAVLTHDGGGSDGHQDDGVPAGDGAVGDGGPGGESPGDDARAVDP
jgi:hypothetical protein